MAVEYKDYYEILGVGRTASQSEIRKAYRKLAKKYHPDVSKEKNADARYREINEAYEVLKDPDKRVKYDTLGANWEQGQNFSPPPGWQGAGAGARKPHVEFGGDWGNFSDFFKTIFGGGFGDAFADQGVAERNIHRDSEVDLELSLEDAARGGTHTLSFQTQRHAAPHTIRVKLPKGITEGSRIRLPGKAPGGGDICVTLHIAPHPVFEVDGYNLSRTVKVAPWQAALGGMISIETLDGNVEMKLPQGTQGGQKFRLRGKGLPKREGSGETHGNLSVRVEISIPKHLTKKQKELWEELARLENL
ncbi:MAG: DnaJ domain-containing protein [Synergistaceae bacterium]|jgi:curved DNA-binding protein|nr:DnaJ domain-containing protein [Synergistaceae bacterium]